MNVGEIAGLFNRVYDGIKWLLRKIGLLWRKQAAAADAVAIVDAIEKAKDGDLKHVNTILRGAPGRLLRDRE